MRCRWRLDRAGHLFGSAGGGRTLVEPSLSFFCVIFITKIEWDLKLNMFCQYIYLWMYAVPAADL